MNSMIPLMGRGPQINDPLEVAGNAASLSNLLQVNQMRQRQMDNEDAQKLAQQKRMQLARQAYEETVTDYNHENSAARTAAATAAANAPQEMPPGSPMPGSANSPLIQGEPSQYAPAQGADVGVQPLKTAGNNMLSDPMFHERYALRAKAYGLDDIAEQAMQHRSALLKEKQPLSEAGKVAADFNNKGGPDVGSRALDKATGLPPGLTYDANGKVVVDKEYVDYWKQTHPDRPLVEINLKEKQQNFENSVKLNTRFMQEPVFTAYHKVKTAFRAVQAAFKNPGPAGDTALATKFMKVLDEDSVVRESEFAIALKARGIWDAASNYANMIVSGEKLTPTQRKEFYKITGDIMAAAEAEYNRLGKEYQETAKRHDLDPALVTSGSLPVERKTEARAAEARAKQANPSFKPIPGWSAEDEARLQAEEQRAMEESRAKQ